jgi:nucleoside-diphosphate-sugar epimerase
MERVTGRTILVTGGTGFVGSNIVRLLHDEFPLVAPTRNQLDLMDMDRVGRYIKKYSVKTIIHCASGPPEESMESRIRMFCSILACSPMVDQILYLGSGAEYDKTQDLIRVKETDFGNRIPKDTYGLSKYLISLLAKREKNITIFRPFGLYGPREDLQRRFISNTIVKYLLGMPIIIKQNAIFDYLYIDDLVSIIRLALKHKIPHGVYNVTPDVSISLSEIVGIIQKITKTEYTPKTLTPGMNYQYTGDNRRLRQVLPTFRFHSYEEGIRELYAYYQKHRRMLDEKEIRKDTYLAHHIVRNNK